MNTVSLCNSTDAKDRLRCAMEGKKAMAETLEKALIKSKTLNLKDLPRKEKPAKWLKQ